ncbi:hypothetical protein CYMTET_20637 [Cymbomonas tetramitiformis]|uniref:Pectin acetylesterase n=1 Tax=Cymbomonas tetramitiformis TaxID=36881 RepID=A0AAE0L3P2_9CHLO|nr:hypothetical protein CYMTET_20637 [Cymbomonas tetramitiformis]
MATYIYMLVLGVVSTYFLPSTEGARAGDFNCLTNLTPAYNITVDFSPTHKDPQFEVQVPDIPVASDVYKFATENAFVSLPFACVKLLNLTANYADKDKWTISWIGRLKDLPTFDLNKCACGWVLFSAGSGGFTGKGLRYARMIPALGYALISPDSFAFPASLGLRSKTALDPLNVSAMSLYWSSNIAYNSSCTWDSRITSKAYPFCYSTDANNVLANPRLWREYYERVYALRKRELDYFVSHMPKFLKEADRIFMLGQSEGAMATARYYHPDLDRVLAGRIISAWSCEFNYYTSCPASAMVCEDKCNKSIPVLNLIGTEDQYFSARNFSVAKRVWQDKKNGYGAATITGSCFSAFAAQNFEKASTLLLDGAAHDATSTHDNLEREVMRDFLNKPSEAHRMSSVARMCIEMEYRGGAEQHLCREDGSEALQRSVESYLVHKQYHFAGGLQTCRHLHPSADIPPSPAGQHDNDGQSDSGVANRDQSRLLFGISFTSITISVIAVGILMVYVRSQRRDQDYTPLQPTRTASSTL